MIWMEGLVVVEQPTHMYTCILQVRAYIYIISIFIAYRYIYLKLKIGFIMNT